MISTFGPYLRPLVLLVAIGSAASRATADETLGLSLLRPDSLAGWEYAAGAPAGWIISDGQLTGTDESTSLLSGVTFDDFELRFGWSVSPGGAWSLGLPDVPNGAGLQITLKEGRGCGAVREGQDELAPGATVTALVTDEMHSATLQRFGGTLSIIVDGAVTAEVTIDPVRRFGLSLAVAGPEASLRDLRLREPRGNPLSNGKDLAGWFVNNDRGTWTVEDGDFVPTSHRGLHYLRTEREYANFTLSLQYKISRGGNSGLAIRTHPDGWPSGDGMELQILDRPGLVKDSTMAVYGNLPPLGRADRPEEWNDVVVKADGRVITCWINGELVQHANTALLPELKHRHLKGWIGLQDHGGKVRFRDVYIHEAPDGMGLDAWYAPRTELGTGIVLDRIMNSERLSRADGITSGVVGAIVPTGGEHVLAELAGPGALVSCWSDFASGQMALYFDGEDEPRIQCPCEHLFDHVPGISHETRPALMCLPFAESLKVVLVDPVAAEYRLEYVKFPPHVACETFAVERPGVPRGLLPAIIYRHDGMSRGKLREAEIYDRVQSEPRTIEPRTAVDLLRLEGAGLVNWLRLSAARSVLTSNDLWIEVTIDGESIPAVAAPARFFYPGFAGELSRSFSSVVLTEQGGFANLLAMPYGDGLTVAARNRSDEPIENVALSMSVDRATDQTRDDYAGRMRLRGIYQPPGADRSELVHQMGSGRWVGFVYEHVEGKNTGIAGVAVDGLARDGWSMEYLDPFFGRPGESPDYFTALAGRQASLAWRYMLLAPVSFEESITVHANADDMVGGRLALFYLKK